MQSKSRVTIKNTDFNFENSLVRITANRSCPEIRLAGFNIGPFQEGNDYEVYHWTALELEKAGIAHPKEEDRLDAAKLNKVQWTERIQTSGQVSKIPDHFYPKLRRRLAELRKEIAKDPERIREYERFRQLTQDITNSRLRKIISIASAPAQTENTLRNFTTEEKMLYDRLYRLIDHWRKQILEYEGGVE
ncbi:hypothetical protein MUP79_08100 [Candidatus Bathyarchaeota archaeon]|jgi:hypothetical protein|nr:hypothetical protein [Candidatus Bathyarchaeota archaeon]